MANFEGKVNVWAVLVILHFFVVAGYCVYISFSSPELFVLVDVDAYEAGLNEGLVRPVSFLMEDLPSVEELEAANLATYEFQLKLWQSFISPFLIHVIAFLCFVAFGLKRELKNEKMCDL